MHDYDRIQPGYQHEGYELGYEQEHEEFLGRIVGGVTGGGHAAPLPDAQELELAVELLEVRSEQELEQFLDGVFSAVGDAIGKFVRSDTGQALGGILKDAAKKALPVVRKAVGDWLGPEHELAPRHLAEEAGSLLGLELEGLSPQDQEFEAARQFVRFASTAAQHAALAPPTLAPETVAAAAATAAAHGFAPGLAHEVQVRDHRRAPAPPVYRPPTPVYRTPSYSPVVRDHRQAYAPPPAYRPQWTGYRGTSWYGRPIAQWAPGYGVRYGSPYGGWGALGRPWASFAAGGAPYRPDWWGYRAPLQYGMPWRGYAGMPWRAYAGVPQPSYGGGPMDDWSQVRVYVGEGPPPAPPGMPGRWIYRGHRHGRRRWAWIPEPAPEPAGPPPGPPVDGAPAFPVEPPPAPPPDPVPVVPPVDLAPVAPPVGVAPNGAPPPGQPQQNGGPPQTAGPGEIGRW
jgi:hypothetical protein